MSFKIILVSVILLFCFFNFIQYTTRISSKYGSSEIKLATQQIREIPPFPAVTVCNLNPYKKSKVVDLPWMKKLEQNKKQEKRSVEVVFSAAIADCQCLGDTPASTTCSANFGKEPQRDNSTCICAYDEFAGDAWPCYPFDWWNKTDCSTCDQHGYCTREIENGNHSCYCQSASDFCIRDEGSEPIKLWEQFNAPPTLGLEGLSIDPKENIIFEMKTFSPDQRKTLKYSKEELIQKCSFAGKDCNMKTDFTTIADPVYGNCFTFNSKRTTQMAGPNSGLELHLKVDVSEYLPTTEFAGAVLTAHDKNEHPFPDRFGTTAPTGLLSTFKIKQSEIRKITDCEPDGKTDIYPDFKYSVEGCYRSCLQQLILHECGCGDPRYPILEGYRHCESSSPIRRKCLSVTRKRLEGVFPSFRCRCLEPCDYSTYSLGYSTAAWPLQFNKCDSQNKTFTECADDFHKHNLVVQVYQESDSYLLRQEYSSYPVSAFLSDLVGGLPAVWLVLCVAVGWILAELVLRERKHKKETENHKESAPAEQEKMNAIA